jgi:hypothetical protein
MSNIQSAMPELYNTSVSAIFAKQAQAIGQVLDNVLLEISNSQTTIITGVTNKNYGSIGYYVNAALAYQKGSDLSVDQYGNPYYAVVNTSPSVMIIAQAAAVEGSSGTLIYVYLKVAQLNSSTNLLEALSSGDLADFVSYMQNYIPIGVTVTIVSLSANVLSFNAEISYDKKYNLTTLQTNIANAMTAFQSSFKFNGIWDNYQFANYIVTNVPGVLAVDITATTIDSIAFTNITTLNSGYFNYGTTTLTYNVI